MDGMTAHQFRQFIIDIYDGGYRSTDGEDIAVQFEITGQDLKEVCDALDTFDREVKGAA